MSREDELYCKPVSKPRFDFDRGRAASLTVA